MSDITTISWTKLLSKLDLLLTDLMVEMADHKAKYFNKNILTFSTLALASN